MKPGQEVAFALLALVAIPALSVRLSDCPRPWFDEGLRTNIARTLLERGEYGTFTSDGVESFPAIPSSGPIEIGAIAGSFTCFGIGMAQARLPSVVFAVIALLLLYGLAQWLWGAPAALVAVLCILAAPRLGGVSFLQLGRQVLGETLALMLALASLASLFAAWARRRRDLALLAGALAALAAMTKGQVAIGLLPALLAGSWAWTRGGSRRWTMLVAVVLGIAVVGLGWQGLKLAGTTAAMRQAQASIFTAQVFSHVIVVVGDRHLPPSAWLIAAVLTGGIAAGVRSLRAVPRPFAWAERWCAELALVTFVAATGVWYFSVSLGWPRYAHAALVLSTLLLGRELHRLLAVRGWMANGRLPGGAVSLALAALVSMNAAWAIYRCAPAGEAQAMGDYIRVAVTRSARIESVEWEVDALSSHWLFHHPPPGQVRAAVEQHTRAEPFHLSYDVLAADPDYLLKGPFSDWVRMYDDDVIAAQFVSEAEIGPYHLYRRRRGG